MKVTFTMPEIVDYSFARFPESRKLRNFARECTLRRCFQSADYHRLTKSRRNGGRISFYISARKARITGRGENEERRRLIV